MKNNTYLSTLREFGLTEHEAKVYLASLSLGRTTILKIARAAEVKRTTVYSVIESLKAKGLLRVEIKGFKTLYAAEDPNRLERVLDEKKEKLKTALPDLSAMYNLKGGESLIKYYEGLNGIKSVYEDLLNNLKAHQDYLVFSNMDEWLLHDKEYFMKFSERRGELARRANVKIRMLLQDTKEAQNFRKVENQYFVKVKILSESIKLKTNLIVTSNKVVVHQLSPLIMAMVIENKSIIQMHREMFDIMWNSC